MRTHEPMKPRQPAVTEALLARSTAMRRQLEAGPELFQAGRFWADIGGQNEALLSRHGVENFKRTLAQNYFNWAVEGPNDPQMQSLLREWADDPSALPLEAELLGDPAVLSINDTSYLLSPSAARGYTLFVGLLWWHATKRAAPGDGDKLAEAAVGNPIPINVQGRAVSQDLANSLREFTRMRPVLEGERPILAEIGAGYGRLGYVASQLKPLRYWIFDIPPALAVAEWHLAEALPDRKIFRWRPFARWDEVADEVMAADIAIFTIDQLRHVPAGIVDCFAAISALHEMRPEQIAAYMNMMSAASKAIYTKNWTVWRNEHDAFDFRSTNLPAPAGWSTVLEAVDEVIPAFTEKLFVAPRA